MLYLDGRQLIVKFAHSMAWHISVAAVGVTGHIETGLDRRMLMTVAYIWQRNRDNLARTRTCMWSSWSHAFSRDCQTIQSMMPLCTLAWNENVRTPNSLEAPRKTEKWEVATTSWEETLQEAFSHMRIISPLPSRAHLWMRSWWKRSRVFIWLEQRQVLTTAFFISV